MTASVHHAIENKTGLLQAIAAFDQFNKDNDPYGEHDFLNFTFEDHSINAKFDFDNGWKLLAVTYCAKVTEAGSKNIIPFPVQKNNIA